MPALIQRYPVTCFVVVAYAFSWACWAAAIYFDVLGDTLLPVTAIGSFGPALAALLVTRTGTPSTAPDAPGRYRRTLAVLVLAAGGIFVLQRLTGGRGALRGTPPDTDITLDAAGALVTMTVILLAAWCFASARSPDRGVRAHMGTLLTWRVRPWLWLFTLAALPGVYLLGAGLTLLFGGPVPTPALFGYDGDGAILLLVVAFLYGAVFGGGNEELGWRGFMLPALQARHSPLVASLIIALAWSFWHLPLHIGGFYGGSQMAGASSVVIAMIVRTLQMLPLTILFTWLYNRSGGNLLLMVVLHALVTVSAFIVPFTQLSMIAGLLLVVTLVFHDEMWKRLAGGGAVSSAPQGRMATAAVVDPSPGHGDRPS